MDTLLAQNTFNVQLPIKIHIFEHLTLLFFIFIHF